MQRALDHLQQHTAAVAQHCAMPWPWVRIKHRHLHHKLHGSQEAARTAQYPRCRSMSTCRLGQILDPLVISAAGW